MEIMAILKLFGLGLLAGYLTGFLIKKALKVIIFITMLIIALLLLTGNKDYVFTIWTPENEFIADILSGLWSRALEKIKSLLAESLWIFGFIVGFIWSLIR